VELSGPWQQQQMQMYSMMNVNNGKWQQWQMAAMANGSDGK